MKVIYQVSQADYQEAILFQLCLKRDTPLSRLRYWAGNLLFLGAAVFFALTRIDYAAWMRITPLVMAALLLLVSSYSRFSLRRQSARTLRQCLKSGVLDEGFLGPHTLTVDQETVRLDYGRKTQKLPCAKIGALHRCETVTLLIAQGVIFEIIPNSTVDRENLAEKLTTAARGAVNRARDRQAEETERLLRQENVRTSGSAPTDVQRSLQGQVAGYRWYYTTRAAWKGSQTVCVILLGYGLFVALTGMSLAIGLAFIVIGTLLNRRLLLTFSPFAGALARGQIAADGANGGGMDYYYTTADELVTVQNGQTHRCKKSDVTAKRENKAFLMFYTNQRDMLVVPKAALPERQDVVRFWNLL